MTDPLDDSTPTTSHLTIVGVGADGWRSLGLRAQGAILESTLLIGSSRQLALIPDTMAERRSWPSPIGPLIDELVDGSLGSACVLASGDPMLHGIGSTLAKRVEPSRLTVHTFPSAFSIACARLKWPAAETELVSLIARPTETLARFLQPGRRLIIYTQGEKGVDEIVRLLQAHQMGPSSLTVLEQLGGDERISSTTVDAWQSRGLTAPYLVALVCRGDAGATPRALVPGLANAAYESDGQLTKREVRAITISALAPLPGELLWDVGAGAGSVAIEWLRAEPLARAIAIEARADRAERIERNARELGVPSLDVRCASAPEIFEDLERPDVIFLGGGMTAPTLLAKCWEYLVTGGRITANAVTLEGEQMLVYSWQTLGGSLTRVEISRPDPIGRMTTWRAQLPVVQWTATKETK